MKLLITGASGFLGRRAAAHFTDLGFQVLTPSHPELDITREEAVLHWFRENRPEAVIHTAAISDIGQCAADPEASHLANVQIPVYLAKAAAGRKLICFSSDQVYSAMADAGPYTEDSVNPGNLYARHKLEMEQRVLDICPEAVMLRAEWMYDRYLKKGNYFMNILNAKDSVRSSSSQYRGVTYVREVAENMEAVARLPGGAYNFGSETHKSMLEITEEFLAFIGKNLPVEDGPGGHNLWMNCEKARKYGVFFSSVEDGLKKCAKDYALVK